MGAKTRAAVVCTGRIKWKSSACMREWEMLRASLLEDPWKEAKITLPVPSYQHIQLKPGTAFTTSSSYNSDSEYFADLSTACIAEIQALYDAGVRNISIDDPNLAYCASTQFPKGCKADGTDTNALLDLYLGAQNDILRELPKDLCTGVHLCRGNMSGSTPWVSGSYESMANKLFNGTQYSTYFLEFEDTERQGGFEALRFLPNGENVVLGLVSTKVAKLEDVEVLKALVRQAAGVMARA